MSLLLPSNQPLMNDPKAEDPKTQMYKIVAEFLLHHTRNLQKLAVTCSPALYPPQNCKDPLNLPTPTPATAYSFRT